MRKENYQKSAIREELKKGTVQMKINLPSFLEKKTNFQFRWILRVCYGHWSGLVGHSQVDQAGGPDGSGGLYGS